MEKRTVIVTGGSQGLGKSISKAFYAAGFQLIIAGRTNTGLVEELGENAFFIKTDVRQPKMLEILVFETIKLTGRIDVLVNNAGISAWRPLEKIDEEFWQNMLDTNLKSVIFASKVVKPYLKSGSSIINISSLAGKRGSANNSVYCATKFGVNGITQALAKELGPNGIRVNAICPVYISSEGLFDALLNTDSPSAGKDIKSFLKGFAETQTALGILPTAEQVSAMCVFLASQEAGAITGQCINVDCGVMPQ